MSVNFEFLKTHDPIIAEMAGFAEQYFAHDPMTCLIKSRQIAEALIKQTAARVGLWTNDREELFRVIQRLQSQGVFDEQIAKLFHGLRDKGNIAAHQFLGGHSEALYQLRMAREVAIWFHRTFGNDPNFNPGAFIPPPDPHQETAALKTELERLRKERAESVQASEDQTRRLSEMEVEVNQTKADALTWQALAEEIEAKAREDREKLDAQLAALQAQAVASPATTHGLIQRAQAAVQKLSLSEADTRRQIDVQLQEAGWEADSETLHYQKGVRPQAGRNLAIAEWPTGNGYADYVLFIGLTPVAVVEAKRRHTDIPGAIEQAKRYSRSYVIHGDERLPGCTWGSYKVPFLFATNGRPYLRQVETKSGIWFLDGRSPKNHPRALEGWYTPEGLEALLAQNHDAAVAALQADSPDYLPLYDFQLEAIRAIEAALAQGQREILLAMATGTGKTRTCVCLVYRLIKARRFRRVLFVVDRSSLGDQVTDNLKDIRLENLQPFTDIYDVKEMGDMKPEPDTKFQIATIQALMKRLFYPSNQNETLPVDQYDCIVVDECHRGYTLDREMSEDELTFRDEADYVSKYRRVLEYFDAVKIGLTATPALHTTEIFGQPVFNYSYRRAVIDGYLIDHEPPIRIVTGLAEDGMVWKAGDQMKVYDPEKGEIDLITLPDEVFSDVEEFNRRVITENFNRVVCRELARQIDPSLDEKTLIFCVNDSHADLVVKLLKEAFDEQYQGVDDDSVMKLTGQSDRPRELIRRYKNEKLPRIAVTVDLLTTGVDVPEIVNLVFIRRVQSRILYDQMIGRATRLCPEIGKEVFHIFDAVNLYAGIGMCSSMKPVVANPSYSLAQLAAELQTVVASPEQEPFSKTILEQIIAKLQRKKRMLKDDTGENLAQVAGMPMENAIRYLQQATPAEASQWLAERPQFALFLDSLTGPGQKLIISEHADELRRVERGYGQATRPEDYLESFTEFIRENLNRIPALLVVTQRPRELTRQQLKELKLTLDHAGFSEASLTVAWREMTNEEMAASIIGFIRSRALGEPLIPYSDRVDHAMKRILGSRAWTTPQRQWLHRIAKQIKLETIVDRDSFEQGAFKSEGGYSRFNKTFDGRLDQVLADINDEMWKETA